MNYIVLCKLIDFEQQTIEQVKRNKFYLSIYTYIFNDLAAASHTFVIILKSDQRRLADIILLL